MHFEALLFVNEIKKNLPTFFDSGKVLEIGSSIVNYTVRGLFNSNEYIGVDLSEGRGVDLIGSGHSVKLDSLFDVVISCECLEHNPYYKETLQNMINHLEHQGMLILSCATTGRPEHGTYRTDPNISPGSSAIGWDYYKNLVKEDIEDVLLDSYMYSYRFFHNPLSADMYLIAFNNSDIDAGVINKVYCDIERSITLCKESAELINTGVRDKSNLDKLVNIYDMEFWHHPLAVNKLTPLLKSNYEPLKQFLSTAYHRSYEGNPEDALAQYNMAKYYESVDDLTCATMQIRKTVDKNSHSAPYLIFALQLLMASGDHKEAYNLVKISKEKHLANLSFLNVACKVALAVKDFGLAELLARKNFYYGDRSPQSYLIFSESLIGIERYDEAIDLLHGALCTLGHYPWIYLKQAISFKGKAEFSLANEVINRGLFHFPDDSRLKKQLIE